MDALEKFTEAMELYEDARKKAVEVGLYLAAAGQVFERHGWSVLEFGPMETADLDTLDPAWGRSSFDYERKRIDLDRWPDREELSATIEQARNALQEARDAWNRLPEGSRRLVNRPEPSFPW